MNKIALQIITIFSLIFTGSIFGVELPVEGKVLVEIKPGNDGNLKVSVKNRTGRSIGYIKFTIENLEESGEVFFENIPDNKIKSQLVKVSSPGKMSVKNVVVVDDEAVTSNPDIKIFVR